MSRAKFLLATLLVAAPAYAEYTLIPTELLFKEPETYSFELSPDGKHLAGFLFVDGIKKLILVDTSTVRTHVLLDFRNFSRYHVRNYEWVDNNTLFLRYGAIGNAADVLAFVEFRLVDGVLEQEFKRSRAHGILVDPMPSVENTVLFARQPDDPDDGYRLYTITVDQLRDAAFRDARESRYRLPGAVFYARDPGSGFLLAATAEDDRIRYWYLDESRKEWVDFFEHDPAAFRFLPIGVLSKGKFAVLTNRDTDRMSLFEFDLASKTIGDALYQHPRYDLINAEVDPEAGSVRSVSYVDHGRIATEYFTEADRNITELLREAFPGKHTQIVAGGQDSTKKVLYVSASDNPGTFYLLDATTGEASILPSRYLEVESYELSRSEVFDVPIADGKQVEAILTRPQVSNGVLLVNPHGGPVGVRDYASYNQEVQFFTNRGYAVLNVNFHGSFGFGKDFMDRGRGQFGKLIEKDIAAVVTRVLSEQEFDDVCAIGMSYGGYSAMMLAIQHPELYGCVVAMFGVFDLPLLFNASNIALLEEQQESLEAVLGSYSEELSEVSPFYLAERVQAPVLLLAGTDDPIADYEQSNRMRYRLEQLGKPVEYFYYAGTGHGHHSWVGDRHQFALIDDFIRRKLELAPPAAVNAPEVIGGEYALIADYYDATVYIDKHDELAFSYYEKAAALDDAYAMYRLASFYETGTVVSRDTERAHEYLLAASERGYGTASYRLGWLYREGKDGLLSSEVDPAKSFEMFRKAGDQGSVVARFEVARALCTGSGVEADLERCLSLLTLDEEDKQGPDAKAKQRRRNDVFTKLVWSIPPESEAMARIVELIGSSFEARSSGLELKVLRSGLQKYNGYLHDDEFAASEGTRFGIEFRVRMQDSRSEEKQFVFKARFLGPPPEDGRDRIVDERLYVGYEDSLYQLLHELGEDLTRYQGEWKLELRTLQDELLEEMTYRVGG